jgi:uncharacterized protein YfaS (alpha-2-macroglobulin family)
VWALGEAGHLDTAESLALFKKEEEVSVFSRAILLINLRNLYAAGQKSVQPFIDQLQSQLVSVLVKEGEMSYVQEHVTEPMNSDLRSTASLILAFDRGAEKNPVIPGLVQALITRDWHEGVFNSQEAVFSIMAILEHVSNQGALSADYDYSFAVNGKTFTKGSIKSSDFYDVRSVEMDLADLKSGDTPNELIAAKDGAGPFVFDAILKRYPAARELGRESKHLFIDRSYTPFGESSALTPDAPFKVGRFYEGRLKLVVTKDIENAQVYAPLPPGLSILRLNDGLPDAGLMAGRKAQAAEFGYEYIPNQLWNFDYAVASDAGLKLYAKKLPAGVYEITFTALATAPGIFNHYPATLQPVYSAADYARTEGEVIEIE